MPDGTPAPPPAPGPRSPKTRPHGKFDKATVRAYEAAEETGAYDDLTHTPSRRRQCACPACPPARRQMWQWLSIDFQRNRLGAFGYSASTSACCWAGGLGLYWLRPDLTARLATENACRRSGNAHFVPAVPIWQHLRLITGGTQAPTAAPVRVCGHRWRSSFLKCVCTHMM
eukprot:CAMPEP_0206010626 /NCGR_PEP_ID=MMETSP1464-20131121/11966_1 /ASSEMBLY_ACC=CAM_ASM_001124 /TAXON_ID=119497 /ORGANISM="Exanthemachrysis gayraliae, Strain RCC1523" /LENGTH=170 /DNA_ID=CAMNT_0053384253 /DNA_START=54 /DNA_END=564 /DNA_ORIENTATION=-